MIPLATLALFAQMTIATPAPANTPTPPPTGENVIRRAPPIPFRIPKGDALIVNSGSTNFSGFSIGVAENGEAIYQTAAGTSRGKVAPATARWLFSHLREFFDRGAQPGNPTAEACMKSASFGSTTTIALGDRATPDVSCPGDALINELNRTATVIEKQLNVTPLPKKRRYIE